MKRKASSHEDLPRKKAKIHYEANTNLFDLLPDEILQEVLRYLNNHDLRWIRLVDSRLFNLIDMRHFDIGVVLDSEMSEVTRVFGRYDRPIGLTFRKPHMLSVDRIAQLTQLSQLISLDISSLTRTGLQIKPDQKLTNLHSLTASVSPDDLLHHTQLTNLMAKHIYFNSEQQVFLTQLQRLSVGAIKVNRVFSFTELELTKYYENLMAGTPNLKHLDLKYPFSFMLSIKCHSTSLESLSTQVAVMDLPVSTMTGLTVLVTQGSYVDWNITHLTNLQHLDITNPCKKKDILEHNRQLLSHNSLLPFKRLESFTLRGSPIDKHLTQLVSTQITQLDIRIDRGEVIDHVTTFGGLQRLTLTANSEGMELDLARLTHLIHLTSLNLYNWSILKNVKTISTFTKLVELNLEMIDNEFYSHALIDLRNLTRLTHLAFKYATPPVNISNMTKLVSLEFCTNPMPIGLSSLHNLTRLQCPYLEEIFTLTLLQELNCAPNNGSIVSDEELMPLSTLTRLTSLIVSPSGSGEPLTRLTRLQRLTVITSKGRNKELQDKLQTKLIYCKAVSFH